MTRPISRLKSMSGNNKVIMSQKINHAIEVVKFIRKTKFLANALLWLVVNEYGVSELFFHILPRFQLIYISKCLQVLHKFIQKHHKKEKIVFWPDLASI
jgi:hypothetical protein